MLLSRFPQQAFIQMAGGDVNVVNVYTLGGFSNSKWASTRSEYSSSNHAYASNVKFMPVLDGWYLLHQ